MLLPQFLAKPTSFFLSGASRQNCEITLPKKIKRKIGSTHGGVGRKRPSEEQREDGERDEGLHGAVVVREDVSQKQSPAFYILELQMFRPT